MGRFAHIVQHACQLDTLPKVIGQVQPFGKPSP
jgi:hypothetical protein